MARAGTSENGYHDVAWAAGEISTCPSFSLLQPCKRRLAIGSFPRFSFLDCSLEVLVC